MGCAMINAPRSPALPTRDTRHATRETQHQATTARAGADQIMRPVAEPAGAPQVPSASDMYVVASDDVIIYRIGMRTIVDIPAASLRALAKICKRSKISRAEAVRRAIDQYLSIHHEVPSDDAFGIWRERGVDALEYEHDLRDEWARR